ncbi:MAG: VTT domain-containing protein [Candidatus Zixiibacteriota bacterium]|nr:MAG: VTT domain-containing protein [candidate division Zixibacteria bacterium]
MEQLLQLIEQVMDKLFAYGPVWIYVVLLLSSFIENIFPPFPGDFITIAGGALAAAGRLNISVVFVLVYLGGIASVMLLYYLGLRFGRDFFIRKNYKYFSVKDIIYLEGWFARRGVILLVFSRFIVGARAAIALVAGIGGYAAVPMCLFASISFWLFNGLLLFSSYVFVVNFETITHYYRLYEKIAWPVIIGAMIVLIAWKLSKSRKNAGSA